MKTFFAKFELMLLVIWKKDDKPLDDKELYHVESYEDTYCFEIKDTGTEDAGNYVCVATNEVGEAVCEIPLEVKGEFLLVDCRIHSFLCVFSVVDPFFSISRFYKIVCVF